MKIRFWGARGSIPVSGEEYLKYGGNTACVEIRSEAGDIIIVDAGSGMRRLGNRLLKEKQFHYHLLFTHAHWDHLIGFPFFKPLYRDETEIMTYGCPCCQASVKKIVYTIMEPPNFPVKFEDIKARFEFQEDCALNFQVGSVFIECIQLSHPNGGLGFRFEEDGKSFVFLTDNELSYRHPGGCERKDYLDFAFGADLLVHDAEFTEKEYRYTKTWGHSTYNEALVFALEAGVKSFGLYHHNQERTDEALDRIVGKCRQTIMEKGSSMACFAVSENPRTEIDL